MNNVVKKLKKQRNSSIVKTTIGTGTKIAHGNIVGAIINTVAGMSITLRETRAIELLTRVCGGDEQAKECLLLTLCNSTHDLNEVITSVILKTIGPFGFAQGPMVFKNYF